MFFFTTGYNQEKNYIISAEEAFNTYSDTVWRLALSKTASKENADDILQEVFIKFIRKSPKFHDEEHCKAWFLRVTINCCNTLLKSPWQTRTCELDDTLYSEIKETSLVYYEVLKLPEKYRTVVHLFYYMGYSVEEISKLLHSKQSTIKTRLYRAREILKQKLKGEEF